MSQSPTSSRRHRAVVATLAVAAFGLAGVAGVAQAQQNRAAQQIKYRQAVFTVLGTQVGIKGAMAQGRSKVAIVSSPNGVSALVMALEDRRIAAAVMNFLIMICSESLS